MLHQPFNKKVVYKIKRRFGAQVHLAFTTNDAELMQDIYNQTELLPNTQTSQELYTMEGYVFDRQIIADYDIRQICFKDGIPKLMKSCKENEYNRMMEWYNYLCNNNITLNEYIISYKPVFIRQKRFIFMPLYPITLDRLPKLEAVVLNRFWYQLSSAINFLHQHNFIQPSNILITTNGDFILGDLGSIVRNGERSESTQAYLPIEMWDIIENRGPIASCSVDWWMLAVILYEKTCGCKIGSRPPTKQVIRDRIAETSDTRTVIPQDIITILLSHLIE
mmetsp:Transcript_15076/g.13621  ORF Transcript_15076/g.13621 Transcript_15076/m.13621 type:complete len:278 (-) Transcript_15076:135-968(-)